VAIPVLVVGLDDPDATVQAAAAMDLVLATACAGAVESAHGEVRESVKALIRSPEDERAMPRNRGASHSTGPRGEILDGTTGSLISP
jgi:hypothetical protein